MLSAGAILLATTQYMPQLVQQDFGYTATWAGLALTPGGLVTMPMMFVVGALSSRVQPKYLIAAGAIFVALSMYQMTAANSGLDFWFFAHSRMLLGVGLPLIFLPSMTASYDGVPSDKTDQASALLNAARNTGGSLGAALIANVLADRGQFHQSRLIEHVIPSKRSVSADAAAGDELFHLARRVASAGATAGDRLDRPAGAGADFAAVLRRRLLGVDAARSGGDSARADPAQRQARRRLGRHALGVHNASLPIPVRWAHEDLTRGLPSGVARPRHGVFLHYPIHIVAPRASRGASLRMSAAEIAMQPAVGVRPGRARWKKIALPRPLTRRVKL